MIAFKLYLLLYIFAIIYAKLYRPQCGCAFQSPVCPAVYFVRMSSPAVQGKSQKGARAVINDFFRGAVIKAGNRDKEPRKRERPA